MNAPQVSVIVPAYNAEKWLPDAIRSVIAQTFQAWELIVVNDGSLDGTSDVAKSFKDSRIRVLEQQNSGVSAARNTGLDAAKGVYITLLDADDAMCPDSLATKVETLEQSGADWIFADVALCDSSLNPIGVYARGKSGNILRNLLLQEGTAVPLSCGNILAKRSCFQQGVRFDEELSNAADQDFTIQLAHRFRGVHVPRTLTLYRNLPESMSKNVQRHQDDHLRLFQKARERGLLEPRKFRNRCLANVYWAIGGSWWLVAHQPFRAVPWFCRSIVRYPPVLLRPIRERLKG